MEWLYFSLLVIFVLLGGLLSVFQLPGTWFILLVAVIYGWSGDFAILTWPMLGLIAGVAMVAEVAEFLAGMKGAQRVGASKQASWGALIGGFAGMLVLTPLIPIPILGSVIGALGGCFLGAYIAEKNVHGNVDQSLRVGYGALLGRLVGLFIKMGATFIMAGITLGVALLALWKTS